MSAALESRRPKRLGLLLAQCAEPGASRQPAFERLRDKIGAEARARARLRAGRESAPVGAPRLTAWLIRAERHHQQVHEEARHGAEDERRAAADAHCEAAEPDVKAEDETPHEGPEAVREGG